MHRDYCRSSIIDRPRQLCTQYYLETAISEHSLWFAAFNPSQSMSLKDSSSDSPSRPDTLSGSEGTIAQGAYSHLKPGDSTQYPNRVRDKEYYFHDGSCVIQVQNYLFKIHKSLLERGSPLFQTLFALPQETHTAECSRGDATEDISPASEGQSDENPIIFEDSVDDFRALCWAIYARPQDVFTQYSWETVDITRLIRILAISQKYEIEHLRDWSWNALDSHSAAHPGQLVPRCGSWRHVARLLSLSQHLPLAQRIQEEWLKRIQTSDSSESRIAFEAALDAAEGSSYLRGFHGKAYYAYLKAVGMFNHGPAIGIEDSTEHVETTPSVFNEHRRIRLCQGFWSLARLRSRLAVAPRIDTIQCGDKHGTECIPRWDEWWKEKMGSINPLPHDPGELIQVMRCQFPDGYQLLSFRQKCDIWGNARQVTLPCSVRVKGKLEEMIAVFNDGLADHFVIPQ